MRTLWDAIASGEAQVGMERGSSVHAWLAGFKTYHFSTGVGYMLA